MSPGDQVPSVFGESSKITINSFLGATALWVGVPPLVPQLVQPCLAPGPLSLLPRVTRSHLAPQPFSKSATEHVQSRLSKKQVPPDLFQVGVTGDREGVPATSGTRGVNPYGGLAKGRLGLVVTGSLRGVEGSQPVWGPPRDGEGVPSRLGVRGIVGRPQGVVVRRLGAPQRVGIGTLDVELTQGDSGVPRHGDTRDSGDPVWQKHPQWLGGSGDIPELEETSRNEGT